jgi:hypothetical protein
MQTPVTTFQPENRPAPPPQRTYSEEELAACSAVPIYGPSGNIVGWSANPACAEYRRKAHPRPRETPTFVDPFSTPMGIRVRQH